MYTQTRSKTVAEATHKLFHSEVGNSVVSRLKEQLTDIQNECLAEHLDFMEYYGEDINLALENLYGSLDDNHIYVLEATDDGDGNIEYYYEELVPLTILYKDDLGNLYYDEGLVVMFGEEYHRLILVEEDNGHYTYTHNIWYEDTNRLSELYTKIEVEVM